MLEMRFCVLSLNRKQKRKLLDLLRFDQIRARQTTIKTCEWLLKRSEYLDWLYEAKFSELHGLLCIEGKPGVRKSTLIKFALTNALKTIRDITVIFFFFNSRGESIEKSTISTHRSLLLQILEQSPALQGIFNSLSILMLSIKNNY